MTHSHPTPRTQTDPRSLARATRRDKARIRHQEARTRQEGGTRATIRPTP